MGMALAGAAGLAGVANNLFNSPSGSQGNASAVPVPQLPYTAQAGQNVISGSGLPGANVGNFTLPAGQQAATNVINNPYAPGMISGAQTASTMGQTAATNAFGFGGSLYPVANSLFGDASTIMNMGLDPQQAMYNLALGQTTQGTRSANESRGIDMTPYGASVESNAIGNFNTNWAYTQLQRAIAGANAAQGLDTAGAGLGTTGANMQANAAGVYNTASGLPYSAYNTVQDNSMGALQAYSNLGQSASNIAQQPISNNLAYLGAANSAANTGLNQSQLAFNQNQTMGANLGGAINSLGNSPWAGQNLGWGPYGQPSPYGWGSGAAPIQYNQGSMQQIGPGSGFNIPGLG